MLLKSVNVSTWVRFAPGTSQRVAKYVFRTSATQTAGKPIREKPLPKAVKRDQFSDFLDGLVSTTPQNIHSYAKNNLNVADVSQLNEAISANPPSNASEVVQVLYSLQRLSKTDKPQAIALLKSDEFVSSMAAHLLATETPANELLKAWHCIVQLQSSASVAPVDSDSPVSITHTFDSFFIKLFELVCRSISNDAVGELSCDAVINLYCSVKKFNVELDKDTAAALEILLAKKIPEIETPATLNLLLKILTPEQLSDIKLSTLILNKIENLANHFLLGELVNIFVVLANTQSRRHHLYEKLSEVIRSRSEILTTDQLVRLCDALNKISFYHPRLISRICLDYVNQASSFDSWFSVGSLRNFFLKARVSDIPVWRALLKWSENRVKVADSHFKMSIGAFAIANIGEIQLRKFRSALSSLKPFPNEAPHAWLSVVWSLAALKILDPALAETVLSEPFQKDLFKPVKFLEEKAFLAQKLMQINAVLKWELKNYNASAAEISEDVNSSLSVDTAFRLKYGKNRRAFEQFYQNITLLIPKECIQSQIYVKEAGCFIDALARIESGKFLPVPAIDMSMPKPLTGYTAVLYFLPNHFLNVYLDPDIKGKRLLGQFQMNVRILQSMGAKVCVIAEHDLQQTSTTMERLTLLKSQLVSPSADYTKVPSWT